MRTSWKSWRGRIHESHRVLAQIQTTVISWGGHGREEGGKCPVSRRIRLGSCDPVGRIIDHSLRRTTVVVVAVAAARPQCPAVITTTTTAYSVSKKTITECISLNAGAVAEFFLPRDAINIYNFISPSYMGA